MGEIDKSFVGNQVLNWDFLDTQDESAVSNVLIKNGSSFFVLGIRKYSFLRWLHFDFQVRIFLKNGLDVLGNEGSPPFPDAFILTTNADEISLFHDISYYFPKNNEPYL